MIYAHTQIFLFIGTENAYVLCAVACKCATDITVLDKFSIRWQAYSYRGP